MRTSKHFVGLKEERDDIKCDIIELCVRNIVWK